MPIFFEVIIKYRLIEYVVVLWGYSMKITTIYRYHLFRIFVLEVVS